MNPFSYPSVAERYVLGRPYFHALIVEKIRQALKTGEKLSRALDVGCGTGMSTRALRALAHRVDGLDSSQGMLDHADPLEGVSYHLGAAEQLPFPSETFELVTVSSAFHWFERVRFLREVSRVLSDRGHLVVYENAFRGRMVGNPEYSAWQQSFYERFPRTPRDTSAFQDEDALACGLRFTLRTDYTNVIEFTASELALYLSTQTNAIEAIERGDMTADALQKSIREHVAPYFGGRERAAFEFCGFLWCLRKVAREEIDRSG